MIRIGEKKVGKNNSCDVRDQDGATPLPRETGHFRSGLKRPVTYTSGSPVSSAAYANQRPSAELLVPISEAGPRRRGRGFARTGPFPLLGEREKPGVGPCFRRVYGDQQPRSIRRYSRNIKAVHELSGL